jgi:hypothetical protein
LRPLLYVVAFEFTGNFATVSPIHDTLDFTIDWAWIGTGTWRGTPSRSLAEFFGRDVCRVSLSHWTTVAHPELMGGSAWLTDSGPFGHVFELRTIGLTAGVAQVRASAYPHLMRLSVALY